MSISIKDLEQYFSNNSEFRKFYDDILIRELQSINLIAEIILEEGEQTLEIIKKYIIKYKIIGVLKDNSKKNYLDLIHLKSFLALYMVYFAMYNYGDKSDDESKSYWLNIFKDLEIEKSIPLQTDMGKMFISVINHKNHPRLQKFKKLDEKNHQYISRILLHGFIPKKNFEHFVNNFLNNSPKQTNSVYEKIESWIQQIKSNKIVTPKSIERFLKYGNPTNKRIIEKLYEIRSSSNQNIYNSIPKYMIEQVKTDKFNNTSKNIAINKYSSRISIEFNYEGLVLYIPEQDITEYRERNINLMIDGKIFNTENFQTFPSNGRNMSYSKKISIPIEKLKSISLMNNLHKVDINYKNIFYLCFDSTSKKLLNFNDKSISSDRVIIVCEKNTDVINAKQEIEWQEINDFRYAFFDISNTGHILKISQNGLEEKIIKESEYKPEIKLENTKSYNFLSSAKGINVFILNDEFGFKVNSVNKNGKVVFNLYKNNYFIKSGFIKSEENVLLNDLEAGNYRIEVNEGLFETSELEFILLPKLNIIAEKNNDDIYDKFIIDFDNKESIELFEFNKDYYKLEKNNNQISIDNIKSSYVDIVLKNCKSTILFKRNPVSWSSHSQNSYDEWHEWNIQTETIFYSAINKKKYKTVMINIDKKYCHDEIYIDLYENNQRYFKGDKIKFYRKDINENFYLLDLSSFINQFEIRKSKSSEIVLVYGDNENSKKILFNIKPQPEFKALSIETLFVDSEFEHFKVDWKKEESLEDEKIKIIVVNPKDHSSLTYFKVGNKPPYTQKIKKMNINENTTWEFYLEIQSKKLDLGTKYNSVIEKISWNRKTNYINISNIKVLDINYERELLKIEFDKGDSQENNFVFIYYDSEDDYECYQKEFTFSDNIEIEIPVSKNSSIWKSYIQTSIDYENDTGEYIFNYQSYNWLREPNNTCKKENKIKVDKIEVVSDNGLESFISIYSKYLQNDNNLYLIYYDRNDKTKVFNSKVLFSENCYISEIPSITNNSYWGAFLYKGDNLNFDLVDKNILVDDGLHILNSKNYRNNNLSNDLYILKNEPLSLKENIKKLDINQSKLISKLFNPNKEIKIKQTLTDKLNERKSFKEYSIKTDETNNNKIPVSPINEIKNTFINDYSITNFIIETIDVSGGFEYAIVSFNENNSKFASEKYLIIGETKIQIIENNQLIKLEVLNVSKSIDCQLIVSNQVKFNFNWTRKDIQYKSNLKVLKSKEMDLSKKELDIYKSLSINVFKDKNYENLTHDIKNLLIPLSPIQKGREIIFRINDEKTKCISFVIENNIDKLITSLNDKEYEMNLLLKRYDYELRDDSKSFNIKRKINGQIIINNDFYNSIEDWIKIFVLFNNIKNVNLNTNLTFKSLKVFSTMPFDKLKDKKHTLVNIDNDLSKYIVNKCSNLFYRLIFNDEFIKNIILERLDSNDNLGFIIRFLSIYIKFSNDKVQFLKKLNSSDEQILNELIMEISHFCFKYAEKELIDDLILVEILISWYYKKSVYSYIKVD